VENPAGKTQQLTPFNILSALSFTAAGLVVYAILFSFHFALRFAGNLICCCLWVCCGFPSHAHIFRGLQQRKANWMRKVGEVWLPHFAFAPQTKRLQARECIFPWKIQAWSEPTVSRLCQLLLLWPMEGRLSRSEGN